MNRKAQVTDSLLPFVNLFVFFIVILFLSFLAQTLANATAGLDYMGYILQLFSDAVIATDITVPLGFGLLVVFQFVSGYKVPTRSFYLIISLILFLLSTLVAALLNNAFDAAITQLSSLGTANFPITLYIMDHMFQYYIILGFAWMFGYYVKSTRGDTSDSSGGNTYFS